MKEVHQEFQWKSEDHDDFTLVEAMKEAQRCLQCAKPLCRTGCPIKNEIPDFIAAIAKGNFGEAIEIIGHRSNLPAICGRVCPKEEQCEGACILGRAKKPIKIGQLERFAADFTSELQKKTKRRIIKDQGKIAVIGSGPAGLTIAGDMAKAGYDVTVFESQSEPGGILLFGIPEFRLGKRIVRREVSHLQDAGVTFVCHTVIGVDKTIDDLFEEGYDAVFIGTGTTVPMELNVPGVEKEGVLQATALLHIVQLAQNDMAEPSDIPVQKGDKVIVVGAGNVAIDAARTSIRLGADVTIVYRRGEEHMPCLRSEYEEAKEEGVAFTFFSAPVEVVGHESATGLRVAKQVISEEGKMHSTGEEDVLEANKIIIAIGHKPNDTLIGPGNEIAVNESGYVVIRDTPYGMTSRPGVFAAGDVVHKPATVVLAMGEAKKVADGMLEYCESKKYNLLPEGDYKEEI